MKNLNESENFNNSNIIPESAKTTMSQATYDNDAKKTVERLNVDKDLQFGIRMARWLDPCCIKNMYTSGQLCRLIEKIICILTNYFSMM